MLTHPDSKEASAGWLSRRSLAVKLLLVTSIATVLIMASISMLMAWQSRLAAVEATQREMAAAMEGVERSLQLVFTTATQRGKELIPVMKRELGGVPVLDGGVIDTDEGGE